MLEISATATDLAVEGYDLLVLGLFVGSPAEDPQLLRLDAATDGALAELLRAHDFRGRAKQQATLTLRVGGATRRIALLGMGKPAQASGEAWLRLGGAAVRLGNAVGATSLGIVAPPAAAVAAATGLDVAALVARGAHLGAYRYDAYRSEPGRVATLTRATVHGSTSMAALARVAQVAAAVAATRDLVNMPALDLYPESFAARAAAAAQAAGVQCDILGPAQLAAAAMNLILAVGRGSARPPRLVHLRYVPPGASASTPSVALVGKGITFDTGGLDLKPAEGMLGMKVDMAGAAAVLGSVLAAARLRLPVRVHGVLALAENMVSGDAIRPSDVFTAAAGKTVEVNNTDAEGRLVLADALHHVLAEKPDCLVDVATLTGACMVALGPHTAGLFSNDAAVGAALQAAARRQGEALWPMPLVPALREQLDSDIADLRNTGERHGGAITAALFLQEFVAGCPWAHLDIAGPATSASEGGHLSKGGTGFAVATLVDFLAIRAADVHA